MNVLLFSSFHSGWASNVTHHNKLVSSNDRQVRKDMVELDNVVCLIENHIVSHFSQIRKGKIDRIHLGRGSLHVGDDEVALDDGTVG